MLIEKTEDVKCRVTEWVKQGIYRLYGCEERKGREESVKK